MFSAFDSDFGTSIIQHVRDFVVFPHREKRL